ncbi:MAG TPA: RpiB/LacA/LacB family sugar-phosphate isomerase, partial [Jiangellaceae bacterium]|nr:RpiB/LacA/LacB family sugar-phosphate isomerase [Jiangellaceae bacterium]
VLGGSGNGEQISANKVRGIRAALVWTDDTARLARQHNDARVISVGVRMHPMEDIVRFVEIFVATPFSGDDRHARRIAMLSRYEETGELPHLAGDPAG